MDGWMDGCCDGAEALVGDGGRWVWGVKTPWKELDTIPRRREKLAL
jgi:hypothetical protein